MAIRIGYNGQVSSGLIFAFDSADFFNSYRGEPTVNTIPSPQVNSYPTFGNGWASYNTNNCLLYTSPSPRDRQKSRMPSSA